jgi:hypothetical protein
VSGLETAIRNALQRSDRANPEIRARIYQSARQALEAGLRKQDITDSEVISGQRQRLEAMIRVIEGEERQRLQANTFVPPDAETLRPPARPAAPAPVPNSPPAAQPRATQPPLRQEPAVEIGPAVQGETRHEPSFAEEPDDDADLGHAGVERDDHFNLDAPERQPSAVPTNARSMNFKPERSAVRRKPRKFFSRLLVFCIVIAALGMGAWWVKSSGVLMTAMQRDTSVRNPPAHVEAEDYNGDDDDDSSDDSATPGKGLATIDPQDSFSAEWIEIFKPTDAPKVTGGAQAKAENVSENEGSAVRITSSSSGADGNATIEVPANVVQQLAGKPSTIALTLQATSDTPSQITIECDFQSLGNCGRHRFDVSRLKSDALFQVRLTPSSAPAAGKLIINTDVDGKGGGVNLYAIRVLPGQ